MNQVQVSAGVGWGESYLGRGGAPRWSSADYWSGRRTRTGLRQSCPRLQSWWWTRLDSGSPVSLWDPLTIYLLRRTECWSGWATPCAWRLLPARTCDRKHRQIQPSTWAEASVSLINVPNVAQHSLIFPAHVCVIFSKSSMSGPSSSCLWNPIKWLINDTSWCRLPHGKLPLIGSWLSAAWLSRLCFRTPIKVEQISCAPWNQHFPCCLLRSLTSFSTYIRQKTNFSTLISLKKGEINVYMHRRFRNTFWTLAAFKPSEIMQTPSLECICISARGFLCWSTHTFGLWHLNVINMSRHTERNNYFAP